MDFVSGELYEVAFQMDGVTIEAIAEIEVRGHELVLADIAIYPVGVDLVVAGPARLLEVVRTLAEQARAAGFRSLRFTGIRLSGRRRGRRVDFVIDLTRSER